MLDTESVSMALRGQGRIGAKILERRPSELCVSALTVAELRYSADHLESPKLHALIDAFISNVEVLAFEEDCASHFGTIANELARRGVPIEEFDILVAAHAVAAEATLVTHHTDHFARVLGLNVENWL